MPQEPVHLEGDQRIQSVVKLVLMQNYNFQTVTTISACFFYYFTQYVIPMILVNTKMFTNVIPAITILTRNEKCFDFPAVGALLWYRTNFKQSCVLFLKRSVKSAHYNRRVPGSIHEKYLEKNTSRSLRKTIRI